MWLRSVNKPSSYLNYSFIVWTYRICSTKYAAENTNVWVCNSRVHLSVAFLVVFIENLNFFYLGLEHLLADGDACTVSLSPGVSPRTDIDNITRLVWGNFPYDFASLNWMWQLEKHFNCYLMDLSSKHFCTLSLQLASLTYIEPPATPHNLLTRKVATPGRKLS